jgi:menaquinol-cytochrome c reductase iron-sulfur subunit
MTTRRSFYHRVIYGIWSLLAVNLGVPAVAYLFSPQKTDENNWVDAGDVTEMKVNKPKEFSFPRIRKDGWKVSTENTTAWVVKKAPGEILAFSPLCTHLGCAYHWDRKSDGFLCPCHSSYFSMEGEVLSGPSPRPLDRYEVRVEGNRLWLGKVIRSGKVTE